MKYLLILLVFSTFFTTYLQEPVFACQCISGRTLQDEYDDSDFIFSATVLDVTSGGVKQISVKTMEQWKGDTLDKISFLSCRGVSSGGVEIKEGQSYLFFAENTTQKHPSGNDCGPTKLLSNAENEILFLDQKSNITRFHYDNSEDGKEFLILCDENEGNAECNLKNNDVESNPVGSKNTGNPNECWYQEDDGSFTPCKIDDGGPSMMFGMFLVIFWPYVVLGITILIIYIVWRKRR